MYLALFYKERIWKRYLTKREWHGLLVVTLDEPQSIPVHTQVTDLVTVLGLPPLFSLIKIKIHESYKARVFIVDDITSSYFCADKLNYETLYSRRYEKATELWFILICSESYPFLNKYFSYSMKSY